MKKLFIPLALLLVIGSSIRVHQREDSSSLVQEAPSTSSTTIPPKVVLPDLGINYKQEITCNNYKRLQLEFSDDLGKLNRVVDKVPDFINMLKSIKTVLEIIVEQFTPSSSTSFIQTNIKSDVSKLEKELFTYEDLEFLTFDQQTQRIIRDIADALKLIKQESKDNQPMITACNRVISEISFLIDYWSQVKEYVEKELINNVFIDRKYKLDNADEVCTKYILEEGQITFKVPEPYQKDNFYTCYKKNITLAKKYTSHQIAVGIDDFVTKNLEEGKEFEISGTTRGLSDSFEFIFCSKFSALLSLKISYVVYRNYASVYSQLMQHIKQQNYYTLASHKSQFGRKISKRAFFRPFVYKFSSFTNKYNFERQVMESKYEFKFVAQSKDKLKKVDVFVLYFI